jgi:hypothetical protein
MVSMTSTVDRMKAQYIEAAVAYWTETNRSTTSRRAHAARRARKAGVDCGTINIVWDREAQQIASRSEGAS